MRISKRDLRTAQRPVVCTGRSLRRRPRLPLLTPILYRFARAGAYALSHNLNGGAASLIGSHARKWTNYVIVLFSGLIVVDVANALLLLTVGEAAEEEEAAAPAEAKAASGEEVEKVASAV